MTGSASTRREILVFGAAGGLCALSGFSARRTPFIGTALADHLSPVGRDRIEPGEGS
jgi:hypothetical protein